MNELYNIVTKQNTITIHDYNRNHSGNQIVLHGKCRY